MLLRKLSLRMSGRLVATFVAIAFLWAISQTAQAGWKLNSGAPVYSNADSTVSLQYVPAKAGEKFQERKLWLYMKDRAGTLLPNTVVARDELVSFPIFQRTSGTALLTVVDDLDKSTSTIEVKAESPATGTSDAWTGHLVLKGEDGLPVTLANQATTAILELTPGTGAMPPTTHIDIKDHRGRTVISRFYKTFELAAGAETVEVPCAGEFELTLKLISDPYTSMPRARYRTPIPISFGKTTSKYEVKNETAGVTTQSVVGVRVALEELPSTATVVSMDKMRLVALGRHSHEMQRNRWPYVIAGSDLINMTRDERKTRGVELLKWQRRLGSSFAPVTVNWADVQPTAGTFRWAKLNDTLPLYRRYMVRPLVTLTGRAPWNNQMPTQTTTTLAAWQKWVSEFSEQYMSVTWGVQPWNHPEQMWHHPQGYIDLLIATADGLQYRNGKRIPSSPFVTGSLARFNGPYLDAILTPATVKRLDAIAFDMFPVDTTVGPESNRFHDTFVFAEGILRRNGADKVETWVTGTGWPAGPGGVTRELQANYMVRTHVSAIAGGVEKIYWNRLFDDEKLTSGKPGNEKFQEMGLLQSNMMPNLSGVAYNLMTYLLSGVTTPTVTRQGKATITSFNLPLQNNKWPGVIYVAWTDSPQNVQTIQLEMTHGGGVYALDYLGAEVPAKKVAGDSVDPIAGTYTVPVGYEPVYIWDAGKPPDRRR